MCVSIIGPRGVPPQLYASAVAVRPDCIGTKNGAPARALHGRIAIRPYPMLALGFPRGPLTGRPCRVSSPGGGFPRGPLAWRLCRLLPHPAGAPVYLNPAVAAAGRKLDR
jgi:hypothetical protein